MPGMSGYEVCEAVKADPNLRHIPVLLLTGTFEAFDQARASAVGAAGHVAKPFEAQTLVDRVKQLLAASAATIIRPAPAAAAAPAARPAAPRAVAPAPPPAPADDAFDFFSDASEPAPQHAAPAAAAADSFDLDEPDAAFAFGDDDLAPELSPARPAARGDSTVAILPEPAIPSSPDAFDFSFEGDATQEPLEPLDAEPVDPARLGHTAMLDPDPESAYDVSSSDLSASFSRGPAAATKVLSVDLDSTPEPAIDPEDITEPDPFATPGAYRSRMPERESFAQRDSFESDSFDRDAFDSEPVMMGEPLAAEEELAIEPVPMPLVPEPMPASAPFVARPVAEDPFEAEPWDDDDSFPGPAISERPAAPAPAAAPMASPELRAELRDTLEKIAWDAFGPLTEKIVREALERVEQVVWEVVPKLAESLIQEEIRRLKGGSDS
jgi:hypothetical protein